MNKKDKEIINCWFDELAAMPTTADGLIINGNKIELMDVKTNDRRYIAVDINKPKKRKGKKQPSYTTLNSNFKTNKSY